MKGLFIITIALLSSCTNASGDSKKKSGTVAYVQALTPHPRILLNSQLKKSIEISIAEDSLFAVLHHQIFKNANRYLTKDPLTPELKGRRLLQSASDFSKRMLVFCYAWQFSKEPVYLNKALEEMEVVCNLDNWNPDHFLDVAEMTFGVGLGYDWLYEALNDSQRQTIRKAIIEKGLHPSLDARYNQWSEKKTNWNQICNAGMMIGALAIYESEKDLANKILLRSLESNFKALEAYGPDGAYSEGIGYWSYGTHFQVILLSAMETSFQPTYSLNIPDVFLKTADYPLHMTGPSGKTFNYSDAIDKPKVNPSLFWLSRKRMDPSLLWHEQNFLKNPWSIGGKDLVFLMLWSNPSQLKEINHPNKTFWYGRGTNPVALMRTGWAPHDFYVGLKGGSPKVNHGHMDVGSFVFDALGERWAIDPGTEDYHLLESNGLNIWSYKQGSDRWRVTRFQTRAHNTIQINGHEQNADGHAEFEELENKGDYYKAKVNLTTLYPELKALSRTAELKNGVFHIKDQIENGNQFSEAQWQIVTDATIDIKSPTLACLSKNKKTICLNAQSSIPSAIRISNLEPSNAFESENRQLKVLELTMNLPPNQYGFFDVTFFQATNGQSKSITFELKNEK